MDLRNGSGGAERRLWQHCLTYMGSDQIAARQELSILVDFYCLPAIFQ